MILGQTPISIRGRGFLYKSIFKLSTPLKIVQHYFVIIEVCKTNLTHAPAKYTSSHTIFMPC